LVAVLALTASALAQKNELTGIIGRTFVSDQGVLNSNLFDNNLHFGEGLTFEVNYGRHLMGNGFARLTFEVPAVFDPEQKVHFASGVEPASYSTYFVTPSLRANAFAGTAVSPWISIGGGFGHFGVADHLEFGGSNPGKGSNTGVFQMGLGLDVRVTHTLSVRGQVRDFWSGRPDLNLDTDKSRQHNFFCRWWRDLAVREELAFIAGPRWLLPRTVPAVAPRLRGIVRSGPLHKHA
jgi:hypothetical protein